MRVCKAASALRRYARNISGIAAVEFALIVPVLIVIMAGVIDYGAYIREKMMLEELARNAAQYVVQGGAAADVVVNVIDPSRIKERATAEGRNLSYAAVEKFECANGVVVAQNEACGGGDYKRRFWEVRVATTYAPLIPYPGVSTTAIPLTGFARLQTK